MNTANLVVPLVTGMLITINARLKPVLRWATCRLASTKIECQIYMFRCGVGPYALERSVSSISANDLEAGAGGRADSAPTKVNGITCDSLCTFASSLDAILQ